MSGISKTIERVKELDKARTQGEWEYDSDYYNSAFIQTIGHNLNVTIGKMVDCAEYAYGFKDLEFICAVANSIMPIIAELDTANKRIAYLEKCNDYYEGNRSTHPSKEDND